MAVFSASAVHTREAAPMSQHHSLDERPSESARRTTAAVTPRWIRAFDCVAISVARPRAAWRRLFSIDSEGAELEANILHDGAGWKEKRTGLGLESIAMRAMIESVRGYETLFARVALAAGFLSAVGDRFGIWGPPGGTNVAWGDFTAFTSYAAKVNPWAPAALMPVIVWTATLAEIALALLLIVGYRTRWAAFGSGVLLLLFALGMTAGTGIKTAFDASVFAASAAGFLLSTQKRFPLSLDDAGG